jgi:hypothetical protein
LREVARADLPEREGPATSSGGKDLTSCILPPQVLLPSPADMAVPRTWENASGNFQTIVTGNAKIAEMLQDMIDTTFMTGKSTRDRKGAMPKKLSLQVVQRVENSELWRKYQIARAAIKAKRPHRCTSIQTRSPILTMQKKHEILTDVDDRVNEVYLWHGTSPMAAASIAKTGFNVNMAGSNVGTMYGNGVYLAECCSKSDEYAKADHEGLYPDWYCLLLCRVVLGEFLTMGAGGEKVHSTIYTSLESGAFESVVGDREAAVGKYREFIVYTGAQVYPEYIAMYKREE